MVHSCNEQIQCILQDIGSHVATPRTSTNTFRLSRTEFDSEGSLTTELEQWIDALDDALPPLKTFILPSGGLSSSSLHVCRSVCRRAERSIYPLVRDGLADESAGRYVNRLSDFLFTAARFAAKSDGKAETIYRKQEGTTTTNN